MRWCPNERRHIVGLGLVRCFYNSTTVTERGFHARLRHFAPRARLCCLLHTFFLLFAITI